MSTTRYGITFETTVNAVDELGWDPDGNDPIDIPTDDGLLIEVPPGEYVFEGTGDHSGVVEGSLQRWGIRGLGDHWTDVQFSTANGQSTRFTNPYPSSRGLLLENISFHNSDSPYGGDIGIRLKAQDQIEVHDVEVLGMSGKEPHCRWTIYPSVHDEDGVANIVNFRLVGPSVHVGHAKSDGGGGVFPGHVGTNNFIRCQIKNQGGDGGMYTGKHGGTTNFYDCYFANNDMALMRMGAGSEIRGCTLVADWENAHPDNIISDELDPSGLNGLYFSTAQFAKSGGGVYDCDIIIRSVHEKAQGAIAINTSEGDMEIKNCRIQCDIDGMDAIWARAPPNRRLNHPIPDKPWDLTIEGCSITGDSDAAAIRLDERHDSVVADCCIDMPDASAGIEASGSDDVTVRDTNINVSGTRVRNARTERVTTEPGVCPPADDSPNMSDSPSNPDIDDGSTSTTHRVEVRCTGDVPARYHFRSDGTISIGGSANPSDPSNPDEISENGTEATGYMLPDGSDSYVVETEDDQQPVTELALLKDIDVVVDGTTVDPDDFDTVETPYWDEEGFSDGSETDGSDTDDSSGDGSSGDSDDSTDDGSSGDTDDDGTDDTTGDGGSGDETSDDGSDIGEGAVSLPATATVTVEIDGTERQFETTITEQTLLLTLLGQIGGDS